MKVGRVVLSACLFWVSGVTFYVGSYFVPIMSNPELQANIVLYYVAPVLAPLAASFYFRDAENTSGVLVGTMMFAVAGSLDALITVPVFIIPYGGSYKTFYLDPGFWFIGLEVIATVLLVWIFTVPRTTNKTT